MALTNRHLTYARYRSQGLPIAKAFEQAGYKSGATNAYRLENRPDIQHQIAAFRAQRQELLSAGESAPVNATSLSELGLTKTFLMQALLNALATAQASADAKTVLSIVSKIVELLDVRFDPSTVEDGNDMSTSEIMAKLEALK